MRNNMLVKNRTFYKSTSKGEGDIKIVYAHANSLSEPAEINSNYNMFVSSITTGEVKIKASPVVICNTLKTKDIAYEDKEAFSIYTVNKNAKAKDYVEQNIICLNVNDARPLHINVLNSQGKEYTVKSAAFYIYDKNSIVENISADTCLKEFDIIDRTNEIIQLQGESHIKHVNAMPLKMEENQPKFNLKNSMVTKKNMLEVLIRDEISLSIKHSKKEDGYDSMPVIETNVVNAANTVESNSAGGDLKALIFTVQQMSFFEFKLKFKENKVKDVFNLPTGLFFDPVQQRIVGTPIQSGRYSISIIFEDSSTMNGVINVPKLNREL